MKKIFKLIPLTFALLAIGCSNNKSSSTSSGTSIDPTKDIKVTFYIDFNKVEEDDGVFATYTIKNGSKLTNPGTPETPPSSEFPVFKGWSDHEVIDNLDDLWNFDEDIIAVTVGLSYKIYGIWMAE